MTQSEIDKRKKAIALFDGWVESDRPHPYEPGLGNIFKKEGTIYRSWIARFKYDSSWNELMPIVEKIESIPESSNIVISGSTASMKEDPEIGIWESKKKAVFIRVSDFCIKFCETNNMNL